jgi:protein tyrosine phosphatase (PTP) superfamily phosphohydrolase (DUF442 family)
MLLIMTLLSLLSESPLPVRVEARSLPNLIRVTDQVYSGGLPDGDSGFEELRRLGIKTVISVDGAKPDIASAERSGLRYVHLPHGYDGIPTARAHEIARALRDLPTPIYIHCHHGKHRSPAAAGVGCVEAGLIDMAHAKALLRLAGTGKNYRGLHTAVDLARPVDHQTLDRADHSFPPVAEIPPLAARMVVMDQLFEQLDNLQKKSFPGSREVENDPPHLALLLQEEYMETARLEETARHPKAFRDLLAVGQEQARLIVEDLNANRSAEASRRLLTLKQNCAACHEQFRDNVAP